MTFTHTPSQGRARCICVHFRECLPSVDSHVKFLTGSQVVDSSLDVLMCDIQVAMNRSLHTSDASCGTISMPTWCVDSSLLPHVDVEPDLHKPDHTSLPLICCTTIIMAVAASETRYQKDQQGSLCYRASSRPGYSHKRINLQTLADAGLPAACKPLQRPDLHRHAIQATGRPRNMCVS